MLLMCVDDLEAYDRHVTYILTKLHQNSKIRQDSFRTFQGSVQIFFDNNSTFLVFLGQAANP